MSLAGRFKHALLVNRTWKQIVLKNMVWATLAEAIVRGLKLLVLPALAKWSAKGKAGLVTFSGLLELLITRTGLATSTL